ncbi:MAG: arylsulfatase [Halieaceae bacterium]
MSRLSNALLLAISLLASTLTFASEQPNIIVMVADDLGWADVGYHQGPIDTPALDQLAAEGVQLDRFYTTPICSPTRAALMTGRDPIRLGVAYATIMPWMNNGIHPDEQFMPMAFRDAGYQTAMVGKWHLGHAQQDFHPNNRGFEHFFGHLHTEVGYFPPFSNQGGKDFQLNGQSITKDGYETFLLADEVSRYIRERDTEKPFFVYMPFIAPHTPLEAPEDLLAKYADMVDDRKPARARNTDNTRRIRKMTGRPSARPLYAAVVDAMDQAIAQVLVTLEEQGIADNTIVLFFSDNGGAAYATGGADNVPLRGGKGETFEGGIRVVSVMRWPAAISQGTKMEQIMTVMDVFPTLAAAAGIETGITRKMDGQNMWPAIVDDVPSPRQQTVFFASETPTYGSFSITAFNEHWKLVQEIEQDNEGTNITNHLFRIADDPYEYNNLAQEYPEVVRQLAQEVRDWRALYPISGVRSQLVPPPGWRAPRDWSTWPRPSDSLRDEYARGMPPGHARKILDRQLGDRGRLIYDCEPSWLAAGFCLNEEINLATEEGERNILLK